MKNTSFFVTGTVFGALCMLIVPAAFVGGYVFRDQMVNTTIISYPTPSTPQPKIGNPTMIPNSEYHSGDYSYDYSVPPEYRSMPELKVY